MADPILSYPRFDRLVPEQRIFKQPQSERTYMSVMQPLEDDPENVGINLFEEEEAAFWTPLTYYGGGSAIADAYAVVPAQAKHHAMSATSTNQFFELAYELNGQITLLSEGEAGINELISFAGTNPLLWQHPDIQFYAGGVIIYLNNGIKYRVLDDLETELTMAAASDAPQVLDQCLTVGRELWLYGADSDSDPRYYRVPLDEEAIEE